ncbi:hypothetical protein RHMOL_Rhmol02G0073700 [Rhododendron molle]|uniref:Uncharacterized protein n=1 Tax=Rhododendron molle TaxID=49168 RepID=A0ACC0PM98_RHOML|nr:hypothetical protein RHMOL_Rhmol02G0073700 [Rhododendron molle]
MTNAKMVGEVWGNRVRAAVDGEGGRGRGGGERGSGEVFGGGDGGRRERGGDLEWKRLGKGAVVEGGSSHQNLEQFLERLG